MYVREQQNVSLPRKSDSIERVRAMQHANGEQSNWLRTCD